MNRVLAYGCWDCGTETPPYQGRCPVCGWPAAPPHAAPRRRRVLPILVLAALFACALTLVVARIGDRYSSRAPHATVGKCSKHELAYRETRAGRVFVCEGCGFTYRIDNRRGRSTIYDR